MAGRHANMARIIGAGMTALQNAKSQHLDAVSLMVEALQLAVRDAGLSLSELDTVIALPSLMSDQHFMIAHAVAQQAKLTPKTGMLVRTLDVGGAGPVAALLAAKHAIEHEGRQAVAIVAGDTVASVPTAEFLARADGSCRPKHKSSSNSSSCATSTSPQAGDEQMPADTAADVPSPVIPNLYDRVARWHMQQYGTTREQLAMCASLMTYQASFHPAALHRRPRLLQEVLCSAPVAPVTTKLECAKLADGAAAMVLVPGSSHHSSSRGVCVVAGGEGSGPLYPPNTITEDCFSAADAAADAYARAGLTPADIHYWGLYDCFPICLIRAVEAVGLAGRCMGGSYIEQQYRQLLGPLEQQQQQQQNVQQHQQPLQQREQHHLPGCQHQKEHHNHQQHQQLQQQQQLASREVWPVNTHGGLLGFGAPWEVPAMHSLIEAVTQLRGEAVGRQVPGAQRALVYGNGGVFSASAVAILESSEGTAAAAAAAAGGKLKHCSSFQQQQQQQPVYGPKL